MSFSSVEVFQEDLPAGVDLVGDIAIDTEAMGLNILRDRLCLVQVRDESGRICLISFQKGSSYSAPRLCSYVSDPARTKIFHFARFDVAIMKYYLGLGRVENIFCTKIASKLVRTYTDHHGLRSVCNELLGVDVLKDQQSSYWGAEVISESQKRYAASDVLHLHALRDRLTGMLVREGRLDMARECFAFINTQADLDINGFSGDMFAH